jgi:7-keto-8-aminopelargonate synthetase-like enzyme
LSRADVVVFPHRDYVALERELSSRAGRRMLVVSETLFSMDGDLADVGTLAALCKRHDAARMLDEAHAIGARGPEGRGVAAVAGVVPDVLIGTCGKALGVYGAFVATTPAIAQLLWNRARSLVYSTALPPMISAAVQAAIEIVRSAEGDDRRRALAERAIRLRELVHANASERQLQSNRSAPGGAPNTVLDLASGDRDRTVLDVVSGGRDRTAQREAPARAVTLGGAPDSAIAPLVIGDDRRVMQLSARLFERRVFVQGIRYPTVAEGSARLRISVAAGHRMEDIETISRIVNDAMSQTI